MKYTFGVPLWLMKKYLTELGGTEIEENVMVGDGWQAVVSKCEPARIGSLVCGRIEVDFTGDGQALETVLDKLHWKSMRGGG
jgi:hypothetical protein